MYSTGSVFFELHVCVAPNSFAHSSLRSSMSTAMIVCAPASAAPAIAASPDATAAEHGHRIAAADVAGVDRRPDAGHHAAAEQAGGGGRCRRDRPSCTGRLRPASCRRTPRCRAPATARCRRSSVIFCVALKVLKQYHGRPRRQTAACPAHRPPVEDDEVAGRHVGHTFADRFDDACGLVSEQEREVVVDPTLAVVQVGVAHAARLDRDHGLAWSGIGDDDRLDADRFALGRRATTPRTSCGIAAEGNPTHHHPTNCPPQPQPWALWGRRFGGVGSNHLPQPQPWALWGRRFGGWWVRRGGGRRAAMPRSSS